jgi:hypothetical protein
MFRAPLSDHSNPCPTLQPDDVVRIQLDALQNNDLTRNNEGIRLAFRFTSPTNQSVMGPVDRFIALLKNPIYSPLLGFVQAHIDGPHVNGNTAEARAHLLHREGFVIAYRFNLTRQADSPFDGCWMTDSLLRLS